MILKKYYINITIRVALIVITCYFFSLFLHKIGEEYYYTVAGIAFLIILQGVLMVKYLNRINRDLALFFNAVRNNDSSLVFPPLAKNRSYKELQNGLNDVNKIIQQIKTENEKKSIYLRNVIDHVDIGLLAFNQEGDIDFFNHAASIITGVQQIKNIHDFGKWNQDFLNTLCSIKPGETKVLKTSFSQNQYDLAVKASMYRFEEQEIKLLSFQNIKHELEKRELESWQKLIRVLNHEIMNSLSPVISLTKTLIDYFKNRDNSTKPVTAINEKIVQKTLNGLSTIEETGTGLIEFVNHYRSITSLPKPILKKERADVLFRNILTLLNEQVKSEKIDIKTEIIPDDLVVAADINQLSQVIINLIFNSIEALKDTDMGMIKLSSCKDESGRIIIEITDNGPGISSEIMEDIFIPFFTTKENGSGIGLSLARQIMRLHNGTIHVRSLPGETIFTLKF
jgi:two-component system nitrogen regulation sensor histidine kinase NtrY